MKEGEHTMSLEKREIRIGLLGFGNMGRAHSYAVQNLPFFYKDLPFSAEIVGVCTTDLERSKKICREKWRIA